MRKRNFLLSLAVFVMTCSVQAQNVYYVDAGVTASGSGDSWATAYKTLEEAVEQTTQSSTDVIFVKKGVYTAPSTDGLGYFFEQKNKVTLYGNCDGTESINNLPVVDMDTDIETVLKAPVEGEETLGRVVTIYKGEVTFVGFDIEGGDAAKAVNKSYGNAQQGGAVWIQGKGTLKYCKIHGAQAITGGGAYLKSQTPEEPAILEYCEIYDNKSTGTTTASQGGGGIHLSAKDVFVRNCIIRNNTSAAFGGGLFGNDSPSPATSLISNCIVKENNAVRSGAIRIARGTIANCLIVGNISENTVGAMELGSGAMIVNSTVVNNKVTESGAVDKASGGIAVTTGLVKNCIIWGNMINGGLTNMDLRLTSHDTDETRVSTVINSCYATSSGANAAHGCQPVLLNNIDSDPLFINDTDFTLQPLSPCINAGDNAAYDLALYSDKDLNGDVRIMDEIIDMGAYEVQGNPTTKKPVLLSDAMEIYSPVKNVLRINSEGNVAIYDISGKLQVERYLSCPTDFSLSSGMYIVSVAGKAYKAIVK